MMTTDISVVMVSHNEGEVLIRCLDSLFSDIDAHPSCNYEVNLVDNASSDGLPEKVRKLFPRVNVTRKHSDIGFSAACNIAMRNSRGRYILVLAPDTEVLPNSTVVLKEFLDGNPDIAGCGGRLLNRDGTVQCNYRNRYNHFSPWHIVLRYTGLLRILETAGILGFDLTNSAELEQARSVHWLHTAFAMVRRDVLDVVGYLDESFFLYGESEDWTFRMRKKGLELFYVPGAAIVHYGRVSVSQEPELIQVHSARSAYIYMRKHHGFVIALFWRGMMVLKYGVKFLLRNRPSARTEAASERSRDTQLTLALLKWCVTGKHSHVAPERG